jgi:hypothetical protein
MKVNFVPFTTYIPILRLVLTVQIVFVRERRRLEINSPQSILIAIWKVDDVDVWSSVRWC